MDRIKKNFGFGCMRLPMSGDEVDKVQMCQMVDAFLEAGFNYFDTAHGYLQGKSETALRDCLTSRYPRDRYVLTDKLTGSYFKTEADIRPFFQRQLEACGVEYFDFYLMHSQHAGNFGHFRECRAYETAFALKAEGKVRHVGISFHDRAEVLEEILTTYPQIEVVQIQFNYADYDDPGVQSRLCYEVCRRHNKPVLVMEPVKGGHLSNLPPQAKAVRAPRRQPRQLCHPLRRRLRGHPDGALRYEHTGADAGQHRLYEGLPAAGSAGAGRRGSGAGDLPRDAPDPLHLLPLLRGWMSPAHRHPQFVRPDEHQATLPRLERRLLL